MTELPDACPNINKANIEIFHAELIPELNNYVGYTDFIINYVEDILSEKYQAKLLAIDNLFSALAQHPQSTRSALVAAFEAEHPTLFRRLYGDLLTYVYSTPEMAERVRTLANSAPREASPHFDPSLLDAVIQNQPGKRRL